MSAPRLLRAAAPILGLVAIALCAGAALADSEPPPVDTPSNTGTLVLVGGLVIAVLVVAVIVLRRSARSRRDKQIYEEYAARRAAKDAEAAEPGSSPPEENE